MNKMQKILTHRFGPLLVLAIIVCALNFIIRLTLLIKSWADVELSLLSFLGIFIVGLFYDLVVWSFFAIPVAFYCWLMKDSWYKKKWGLIPLFILFSILILILVFSAGGEIVFWDEFNVRYNFIAVDYLIYTTEVINNIIESYNMPLIIGSVLLVVFFVLFLENSLIFLK